MSLGAWGWLVLAFPLAGAIVCALLYRAQNKKLVGYESPGHGYEFDLHTGKCVHDPGLELRRYKITIVGTEIWVDLL